MKALAGLIAAFVMAVPARADVILACTFETLPQIVMTYPDGPDAVAMMQVGGRPPAEMTRGQGTMRFESASVDGYLFRFAPANMVMDVERDGQVVASETAHCAAIGGPANDKPLMFGVAAEGATDTSEVASEQSADNTGAWLISEDKSALDDTRTVVAILASTTNLPGQYTGSFNPTLYLRCMENTTVAYLNMGDYFLASLQGYGRVDYRVDEKKATFKNMEESTDNHALGLWSGRKSIPFIKELFGGKKLVMRVTPYNESPKEFEFDISGTEAAVKGLREACKW